MPKRFCIFLLFGILLSAINGFAQTQNSPQNREALKKRIKSLPISTVKLKAVQIAQERNLPVRNIYDNGKVIEIADFTPGGYPIYYTTHNLNAAKTTSTNKLWSVSNYGYFLEGSGMTVGV